MSKPRLPRQGEVYWLDACPPLDGDRAKRRPVVVISTDQVIKSGAQVLIVAGITSTLLARRAEYCIPLPNREQNPGCSTGLPRRCWLVPEWFLAVEVARLQERAGCLSSKLKARVVDAVLKRMRH